jgi:uncharacterized protein YoxC
MAEYATTKDVQGIVNKAVDDLSAIIDNLAQSMHGELQEVKTEISDVHASIDRLTNTIDGFVKRLDDIETDNTARDAQLARFDRWIHQIAKKTGVKLEI